jgi:hypothetical protein
MEDVRPVELLSKALAAEPASIVPSSIPVPIDLMASTFSAAAPVNDSNL